MRASEHLISEILRQYPTRIKQIEPSYAQTANCSRKKKLTNINYTVDELGISTRRLIDRARFEREMNARIKRPLQTCHIDQLVSLHGRDEFNKLHSAEELDDDNATSH